MSNTVLLLGTFDSKGKEFDYLYQELVRRGVDILSMNTGVYPETCSFVVDISAGEVALAGGESLESLRERADRGHAMNVMAGGARALAVRLQAEGTIQGVISMGGGGGTSIATKAMQALPYGFPKLCITTLASGDTHEYVGTKDIVLFPSIVDIAGINAFSRKIISRAAGAICGMMEMDPEETESDRKLVAITMFGNSTAGAEKCAALLEKEGYAPIIFHATGGGGRAMEEMIRAGVFAASLDITTTEWADELCGGILSAGPERLDAAAEIGIPQVIAPGCVDMVNFGTMPTVPQKYKDAKRLFYEWNPMVILMRTNVEENQRLGTILAEKANRSKGPVGMVLPTGGLSILDGDGQPFCDREADEALFEAIVQTLKETIPVERVPANINDDLFAEKAVGLLLNLINERT